LEKNRDRLINDWDVTKKYFKIFSTNPSIFELDYQALKERCAIYKEELIQVALHPSRIEKYLEQGIDLAELDDFI